MARFRKDSALRSDLRACTGDGMTYSFMVGTGETYFAVFAIALGSSDRVGGLIASVPPLVGATLQLFAPVLAARVKSPSRWIQTCALLQVASFIPMIVGAIVGALPMWVLFLVAGVYWTAALGAGGVWNTWIGLCFPAAIRPRYFGIRSRLCQATLLAALVIAGVILQSTHGTPWALAGFAGLFILAAGARAASIPYLRRQRDPAEWPEHRGVPLWHLVAMQVAVQMGQPFLNPYLVKQVDVSPALYLGLIGASFAAKSVALPFLGMHAKSRGARSLLAFGAVGTAFMILPWIWVHSVPGMFAIQAVSGVVQGAWELAAFLLFLETIPSEERTSVMTGYYFLIALAMAGGSLLGAALLGAAPGPAAYDLVFAVSTGARVAALCLLPFVHVEVLRAIPLVSSTLALRLNAGSIEAPIPGSLDERGERR
jgi:MFS family permease